jgi:mRNA interferase MazF
MTSSATYQRGDVVLIALPLVTDPSQSKSRPAVVIQNDIGNRYSPNLIVAAISSRLPARSYPTNVIVRTGSTLALGCGLDRDSVVQGEVILTVQKTAVVRRLGQFNAEAMQLIDQCIRVSLGLTL